MGRVLLSFKQSYATFIELPWCVCLCASYLQFFSYFNGLNWVFDLEGILAFNISTSEYLMIVSFDRVVSIQISIKL